MMIMPSLQNPPGGAALALTLGLTTGFGAAAAADGSDKLAHGGVGGNFAIELIAPSGGFDLSAGGGSVPPSIDFAIECSGGDTSGAGPTAQVQYRLQSGNANPSLNFGPGSSATVSVGCGAQANPTRVSIDVFPNDLGPDLTGQLVLLSARIDGVGSVPLSGLDVPFTIRSGGVPDLQVDISPSFAAVSEGQNTQFNVRAANIDQVINSAITRMTLQVPNGLRVTQVAPGCSNAGQRVDCELGALGHDDAESVPLSLTSTGELAGEVGQLLARLANGNGTSVDTAASSIRVVNSGGGGGNPGNARLLNISTNAGVDAGGMLAGFIVTGSGEKRFAVLADDVGLADPVLDLVRFDGGQIGEVVESNDDWQTHPTAEELVQNLRAPFTERSAGFAVDLGPGTYLARVAGKNGAAGRALVGVQELGGAEQPRLLNISTNAIVDGGGMLAGFIVTGSGERRFAVLAEDFGLEDPVLDLVRFDDGEIGEVIESNDDWREHQSSDLVRGALREPRTERSAAFAVDLGPGTYLARVIGKDGATGRVLVGVQEIGD